MKAVATAIPEVKLLEPRIFEDSRGFFFESYNQRVLAGLGISGPFVQDNQSFSHRDVVRGLHYQIEQAQGKLIRCLVGEIFDVAVDIRRSSPSFGKWVGEILSAANHRMLWIPAGFAHGFMVLSQGAEVLYKATDFYAPQHERTILWNDPTLQIEWPHQTQAILSAKDLAGATLQNAEVYEQSAAVK
ncbi:MAG TPA: dTDP-4-dehydrorhamnose 3,5-epimerase [Acidobacteriaceae bacterium]|nr:dTDP-4-dehydrorhamnose 3,5-epimerase [Acidobacteriaceae bacterium]